MADLSDIDLTLRSEVAVPLTAVQHDANLTGIEDAINAINAKLNLLDNNVETYGEMYQADNAIATTVTDADTWYMVGNFTAGHLDKITFDSDTLIVPTDGDYLVAVTASLSSGTGNEIKVGFGVDGTVDENHVAESELQSTDVVSLSCVGIVEATAGQAISLHVKNVPATTDIVVIHATMVVQKMH